MSDKNISVGRFEVENYVVWALSSTLPDYRLAWLLNNQWQITLQRDDTVRGKEGLMFAVFTAEDALSALKYILISNKNTQDGSILLTDYHTVDFFLKISGTITPKRLNEFRKKLRNIPEITACIPIVSEKKTSRLFFAHL